MFHDFGASPLNFTMAKATGFQSVFSPACKPILKERPNNSIPAAEIKRWDLMTLVDARFPFGGGISCNPYKTRHSLPAFRVYGTGRRKSTMGDEGAPCRSETIPIHQRHSIFSLVPEKGKAPPERGFLGIAETGVTGRLLLQLGLVRGP